MPDKEHYTINGREHVLLRIDHVSGFERLTPGFEQVHQAFVDHLTTKCLKMTISNTSRSK